MRIYKTFKEAHSEIERDLAEMGIRVHPQTMQDKFVQTDPDYETLELQNYIYTVTEPRMEHLEPTQPWADAEFEERVIGYTSPSGGGRGYGINPGEAWKLRREVWDEFIHDGEFAYTYSDRYAPQLHNLVTQAILNKDSRQLFLGMWDREVDSHRLGGHGRVPCSLGYLFQIRGGMLNMTYFMRSCDFVTHFQNDVYLSHKLQLFIGKEIGVPMGHFTQYMGSLHMYRKDAKGVF